MNNLVKSIVCHASAFLYGHAENILKTMLCSSDKVERQFAVQKIFKSKEKENNKSRSVRYSKILKINPPSENQVELVLCLAYSPKFGTVSVTERFTTFKSFFLNRNKL